MGRCQGTAILWLKSGAVEKDDGHVPSVQLLAVTDSSLHRGNITRQLCLQRDVELGLIVQ